jgi:hypothetical protein
MAYPTLAATWGNVGGVAGQRSAWGRGVAERRHDGGGNLL